MAESQANAIEIAFYTALSNSAELVALLADNVQASGFPAIYSYVPQIGDTGDDNVFPYIVIGEDTLTDWSTDTASGIEAMATIHTWSRTNGRRETKQIQGAIYNALHRAELTTPDHEFIGCEFETSDIVLDPDMQTHHGTSQFRVTIDEVGFGE